MKFPVFVSATIYFSRDILMTLGDSASMIETESNITAQLLQMAANKAWQQSLRLA